MNKSFYSKVTDLFSTNFLYVSLEILLLNFATYILELLKQLSLLLGRKYLIIQMLEFGKTL